MDSAFPNCWAKEEIKRKEGGCACVGAWEGGSGAWQELGRWVSIGWTGGVCGGKQRIFQVLACGVCGVTAGGEDWKEKSTETAMLAVGSVAATGTCQICPFCGWWVAVRGEPEFAAEPEHPCLCLHQTVKHSLLWSVEASGKQFKQWQLCLIKEKKNTANLQMPSLCLEYSSERLYLLGGKAGKFPHLSKDPRFSFRNFPVKRCGCYWDTPPPQLFLLVQLCFAMAFPSAFPSLCWAGFCRVFLFVVPFPGRFPFCGEPRGIPTGWSRGMDLLRVAGITWLSPCVWAPLGAPDRCYWQRGWFWSQCRNHCLFSPDAQPPAPWCPAQLGPAIHPL